MKLSFFEKLFGYSKTEDEVQSAVEERVHAPETLAPRYTIKPAAPAQQPPPSPRSFTSNPQQKRQAMEESGRSGDLNTIIGKGALIEGTIKVQNSMRLDGKVSGHILTTDSLVVGKEGEVTGEVRTKNAIIGGRLNGQIFASGKVVLEARATLAGDIKTAKLTISDGARFDGNVAMSEDGGIKAIAQSSQAAGPGKYDRVAGKR
ncbi:polymer-forming cytoskeletal protein [candidate division KSB1 bacterium]|nr:MAG: polymer-forming cytoskeletal protein [candidate division KSB1 bacterium]MBC6947676.1 polymer-forming cytoskeletal protein [candidate division KSB1 bacterium]MCE7943049.1 polymer-forming cytoskeletal protein [Chlorobi bacterium CHB1]MDL1874009.1 polymer-forming cytoskeletal protein [Cytophagia bacterium CHB2]